MVVIGALSNGPHCPPPATVGVTLLDGAEAGPVPTLLVAVTVKV